MPDEPAVQTTPMAILDEILDRVYDLRRSPTWLLLRLEDLRQAIEREAVDAR